MRCVTLAGISANAELLREALQDPDDLEGVDIILGEVDRLGRLKWTSCSTRVNAFRIAPR